MGLLLLLLLEERGHVECGRGALNPRQAAVCSAATTTTSSSTWQRGVLLQVHRPEGIEGWAAG
jgi:hypothetical protein